MLKRGDKKGLEMAISSIILIILGLLVLIAIVFIFNRSAGSFADKINTFLNPSNVDSVVDNCNSLVVQENSYEYCCVKKTVRLSTKQTLEVTCGNATTASWAKNIQKINCDNVC